MSFPKYPAYKDSGVEWIGEIPVGWKILTLKRAAKVPLSYGANASAENDNSDWPRFIRITDIDDAGLLRADTFRSLPPEEASEYLLDDGDILFARSGATVGKSFLYKNQYGLACYAGYLIRLRINHNFLSEYVYYFSLSSTCKEQIENGQIQSTIQNFSAEKYANLIIPFPPLPEQQAIASFLDRECGKIDALIAEQKQLIALLAEKRQAVISHAVTKGLNPNAPMKDSGIPWIGMVPEGWDVVKIKRAGKLKGGYAFSTDLFVETGIPVVRMSNLKRGEIDFSDAVFINNDDLVPSASLSVGDLVWGMSGSIGVTGSLGNYARVKENDIPCQLNQRVGCFALSKLDNDFMECIVQADFFCDQIVLSCTGTAQFNVSSSQVEDCYVAVPPMEDQKRISNFLKAYFQKQTNLYANSEQSITLLKERRAALISAAVTGKIDVRTQSKALAA